MGHGTGSNEKRADSFDVLVPTPPAAERGRYRGTAGRHRLDIRRTRPDAVQGSAGIVHGKNPNKDATSRDPLPDITPRGEQGQAAGRRTRSQGDAPG